MAENQSACPEIHDPLEKEFRRKNLWHSFKNALYGAVGGGASIAVMMAATKGIAEGTLMTALSGAVTNMAFLPLLTATAPFAAIALIGAVAIYCAQKEYTELRCLQDAQLARKNALALAQGKHIAKPAPTPEYDNPGRSDGKEWKTVIAPQPGAARTPA